jgi:L,D-transpeptidase catalytic domain/Bacterial Ig domain/Putative peptidoglycan binding domain
MRTGTVVGLIVTVVVSVIAVGGVLVARAYADRTVVESVSPAPGTTVNGSSPIRVILNAPEAAQTVAITVDGDDATAQATKTASGYVLSMPKLVDGPHVVNVHVTSSNMIDKTDTYHWTFSTDATAPTLTATTPSNWTDSAVISGVSEPGATVTASWQGGEVVTTADTTGHFSLTPVIPDGKTPLTLIAADAAGNETRASHVMLVDSGRPSIKIGGVDRWIRDTDHPKVYAFVDSASPTTIVAKINGQDAKVTPLSIGYTIEAGQLPQGTSELTLYITNSVGHTTTRTKQINVDSTETLTNSLTLAPGARGKDVARLTRRLKVAGFWKGKFSWTYNAKVVAAVKAFEKKSSLPEDGIARPELLARTAGKIVVIEHLFKLNLYLDGKLFKQYPVAVGQSMYPTPTGNFVITNKIKNPTWTPPNSPWAAGLEAIPPGVNNPLGTRWIGTSASLVGIHGTNEDWTIGSAASHGCIRMHISDVEALFPHVTVGMPVEIKP